jgi:ferrous iron transport protein A
MTSHRKESSRSFPLALAAEGTHLRIAGIRSGKGLAHRLATMGLIEGAELELVQRQAVGAVVVALGETRYALGAGMAHKIWVTVSGGTSQDGELGRDEGG